jgi:hypothetical protein
MALFGTGLSPKAQLQRKWAAYYSRIEERNRRIKARQAQLCDLLENNDAFNRAMLEAFCDDRLFLPVDGLESMTYLQEQGFYWEWHDSQTARVLFPDGWKLVPSELNQERDSLYMAMLVGPDETKVATISYCGYPYLASIRRLV